MRDDHYNETAKMKKFDFGGGLNAGWSPPHPPSKKASIPDCSQEVFEEIDQGWHCSSWEKGFPGGLKYRGLPYNDIPPTNSSRYMSVLPPSFHVPK